MHVAPGQTVAIVGQTGTGKTTFAKLINRTYEVNRGQVLVDGIDVREWNLAALRRQISIIEQDVFLFSRTLAENIAFGCPGATQADIEAAAQAAQAHDFITSFQDGYQTVTQSGGYQDGRCDADGQQNNEGFVIHTAASHFPWVEKSW